MIIGIGTDFVRMDSIPDASLRPGDPFREKTYTRKEQQQADSRPVPRDYYCTRFAGKEAVFKTLGADPEHARLNEIEILDDSFGAPHVTIHGTLKQHADSRGIATTHITLTYDSGYAIAFAVSEGEV